MDGRTYIRTDIHDAMAIKPNFLTSMGYPIFLAMMLGARGAPLLLLFMLFFFHTELSLPNMRT